MTRMTGTMTLMAALAAGLGCSHAEPKPEPRPRTVAAAPKARPAPTPSEAVRDVPPPPADSAAEAIFFDVDSSTLRQDARPTLQAVGNQLSHSRRSLRIEGNCDERGTTEYNIALGERRAAEAKRYLERLGIAGSRISVVSYGAERPHDPGHDETAWSRNRRDDFKIQ